MPKPQAPQRQQQPQTGGPVDKVPCPSCGKPNNFRGHYETLETGNVFTCDYCKQPMQIAGIRDIKYVIVRRPQGQVQLVKGRR